LTSTFELRDYQTVPETFPTHHQDSSSDLKDRPCQQSRVRKDLGDGLSAQQAGEAAYRFVARYYENERTSSILRLLEAMSWAGDQSDSSGDGLAMWQVCVQEALAEAPLPALPPPWDA
jgi:hypothetical protein